MKRVKLWMGLMGMCIMIGTPQLVNAMNGDPVAQFRLNPAAFNLLKMDTIQTPVISIDSSHKTPGQVVTNKPGKGVIVKVPKARRQPIPIPVRMNVKPIKIIKPIIRPILKVLH